MGRGGRALRWRVWRSMLATVLCSILGIRTRSPTIVPCPASATFRALRTCRKYPRRTELTKKKWWFKPKQSLNPRFSPVPISVSEHKRRSPHYLSCSPQSQEACQWHPESKELGGLHQLWLVWAAVRSTSLQGREDTGGLMLSCRLSQNQRKNACRRKQSQFISQGCAALLHLALCCTEAVASLQSSGCSPRHRDSVQD